MCYWPTHGDVYEMAQSIQVPDNTWTKWLIQRVAVTSDTFRRAESKMTEGNLSTTDASEVEGPETPRKKMRASKGSAFTHNGGHPNVPDTKPPSHEPPKTQYRMNQNYSVAGPGHGQPSDDGSSSDDELPQRKSAFLNQELFPTEDFMPGMNFNVEVPTPVDVNAVISKIQEQQVAMASKIDLLEMKIDSIHQVVQDTNLVIREYCSNDHSRREDHTTSNFTSPFILPATSCEELDELLQRDGIVEYLKRFEEASLSGTLRSMTKKLVTKEVALKFSFTGMGAKRQKTKISLKDHKLYEILNRALQETSHRTESRLRIDTTLQCLLKNVIDWSGNRSHRKKSDTNNNSVEAGPIQTGAAGEGTSRSADIKVAELEASTASVVSASISSLLTLG